MYDIEREEKIMEILKQKHTVGVNRLAEMVYCSGATIRRDLARMEKKGLVIRTFGAVTLNTTSSNSETPFEVREKSSIAEKRYLAQKAASLLRDNSTIFIDSSSTLFYIVPFIKEFNNILIITNGLRIANEILNQTKHTVVMIGGTIQPNTNSVLGALAFDQIKSLHADFALISCFGFDIDFGLTEASADSAIIKKIMVDNSSYIISVFDNTKFGQKAAFKSIDINKINAIVTNKDFSSDASKYLKDNDILVLK